MYSIVRSPVILLVIVDTFLSIVVAIVPRNSAPPADTSPRRPRMCSGCYRCCCAGRGRRRCVVVVASSPSTCCRRRRIVAALLPPPSPPLLFYYCARNDDVERRGAAFAATLPPDVCHRLLYRQPRHRCLCTRRRDVPPARNRVLNLFVPMYKILLALLQLSLSINVKQGTLHHKQLL